MTKVDLATAQELAGAVLNRVSDCAIRLASLELESSTPKQQTSLRAETTLVLGAQLHDAAVVCLSRYEVSAAPLDEAGERSDDEDRWRISIEMHGRWDLRPGEEPLTDLHAQAFCLAVGAMALHPYVRSQVQTTVSAAGYPLFTLDILQSLLQPDPVDGQVDLSVVDVVER